MVEDNLYTNEFISLMQEKISHKSTLANIIADLLEIDKDAVYRRLRGDVNFSFTEIALIARRLGISLDKIAGLENLQIRPAQIHVFHQVAPTSVDYEMFDEYLDLLKSAKDKPDTEIVEAVNLFPQYLYQDYEYLTRYHLFGWNHAIMNSDILPYHEITIPAQMRIFQRQACEYARSVSSTTYVWDNMLLQRYATNIKYFAQTNLIKKEDVSLIKNDLMMLINRIEKIAIKGRHEDTGKEVSLFIANVATDTNYSCLKAKDIHLTFIKAFIFNATVSYDVEVYNYACAWIHLMQRMSTLISVSGEKARTTYFDAQREIINTL